MKRTREINFAAHLRKTTPPWMIFQGGVVIQIPLQLLDNGVRIRHLGRTPD
jgi:hypothetical protein